MRIFVSVREIFRKWNENILTRALNTSLFSAKYYFYFHHFIYQVTHSLLSSHVSWVGKTIFAKMKSERKKINRMSKRPLPPFSSFARIFPLSSHIIIYLFHIWYTYELSNRNNYNYRVCELCICSYRREFNFKLTFWTHRYVKKIFHNEIEYWQV